MNIKEIFRLTKYRLILGVVLFFLLPVPATAINFGSPAQCDGLQTCTLGNVTIFVPFGGVFFATAIIFGVHNQPFMNLMDFAWKVPYLIILSYILACFVILFFRKI